MKFLSNPRTTDPRLFIQPYIEQVYLHERVHKQPGIEYGLRYWRIKEQTETHITISEVNPWGKGKSHPHLNPLGGPKPELLHTLTVEEFKTLKQCM